MKPSEDLAKRRAKKAERPDQQTETKQKPFKKSEKGNMLKCPLEDKWYSDKEFLFQKQAGYNICLNCGVVFYPPRSIEILRRGVEEDRVKRESGIIVVKDDMLTPGN